MRIASWRCGFRNSAKRAPVAILTVSKTPKWNTFSRCSTFTPQCRMPSRNGLSNFFSVLPLNPDSDNYHQTPKGVPLTADSRQPTAIKLWKAQDPSTIPKSDSFPPASTETRLNTATAGCSCLGVSTGGRISELLSLTVGDVYQSQPSQFIPTATAVGRAFWR